MKIYTSYPEVIANKNTYSTDPKLRANCFLGTSLHFFKNIGKAIWISNRKAKNGTYDDYNWAAASLEILRGAEKAGLEFHFSGLNNITSFDGPAVFIANHMSTLETLILPCIIHPVKRCLFVTKQELTDYPVFGPVNSAREPIIVGRKNPREDLKHVMEEGAQRISEGKSIIIFPQKTRSFELNPKNFNTLGIKLAQRNNIPIVPIGLVADAWGNGKYIKELGKIDPKKKVMIEFGEPMEVKDKGHEEHQACIDHIANCLRKWGRDELIK